MRAATVSPGHSLIESASPDHRSEEYLGFGIAWRCGLLSMAKTCLFRSAGYFGAGRAPEVLVAGVPSRPAP